MGDWVREIGSVSVEKRQAIDWFEVAPQGKAVIGRGLLCRIARVGLDEPT